MSPPLPQKARHLTIKAFAENDFNIFKEIIFKKMDSFADSLCLMSNDLENMRGELREYKKLKCKCKRVSERHSVS